MPEVAQGAVVGASLAVGGAILIGLVGVVFIVLKNLKPLGWGLVIAAVVIGAYLLI